MQKPNILPQWKARGSEGGGGWTGEGYKVWITENPVFALNLRKGKPLKLFLGTGEPTNIFHSKWKPKENIVYLPCIALCLEKWITNNVCT